MLISYPPCKGCWVETKAPCLKLSRKIGCHRMCCLITVFLLPNPERKILADEPVQNGDHKLRKCIGCIGRTERPEARCRIFGGYASRDAKAAEVNCLGWCWKYSDAI